MSLIAGLFFGGLSAYGAYNVSNDPKNILVSLGECILFKIHTMEEMRNENFCQYIFYN